MQISLEALQRALVIAQICLAVFHPDADERKRRKQAASRRIGRKLAEERLGVERGVQQTGQRFGVEKQQPVLAQIG